MLTYALAWIVALASLGLYLSAAAFPEVHRKNDYVLGGIGLFYALILWANAKTIPIGLLIGQVASVTLIVWLGRQALQQRSLLAPAEAPRPTPGSISDRIRSLMIRVGQLWEPLVTIIGDVVNSTLNRSDTPERVDAAGAEPEETAASPFAKLSQAIRKRLKAEDADTISNTVTVNASHDLEEDSATAVGNVETEPAPETVPHNSDSVETDDTTVVEQPTNAAPESQPEATVDVPSTVPADSSASDAAADAIAPDQINAEPPATDSPSPQTGEWTDPDPLA